MNARSDIASRSAEPSSWLTRLRRVLVIAVAIVAGAVALPILLLLGSVFVWDRAEHEIHLVPAGYEGPVVIIHGDSAGAPERRERRARVYEIPPSGVLRTRFAQNLGWGAPDFYYVDGGGRRTPIRWDARCEDSLPGGPVQVCLMPEIIVAGRTTPAYRSYVVGRHASSHAMYARWDSLVRSEVFGESTPAGHATPRR
jgi:hypothetical protein